MQARLPGKFPAQAAFPAAPPTNARPARRKMYMVDKPSSGAMQLWQWPFYNTGELIRRQFGAPGDLGW